MSIVPSAAHPPPSRCPLSAPSSAIKYIWCSVFSSKEEQGTTRRRRGRRRRRRRRGNVSKSLEWRHMAVPLSLRWRRHCGGGPRFTAAALLVVVSEDINYVGVTLLKNIIGEKRKRGRARCTAPFSSPPFRPCASPSSSPFAFSAIFFAAAFTEICSAQRSLPFFGKMWQFMRGCRAE